MGLAYKSGRDTEMRKEFWDGDLERHFRILENYLIKGIRKKSWRL
jgi:hypothetical protein